MSNVIQTEDKIPLLGSTTSSSAIDPPKGIKMKCLTYSYSMKFSTEIRLYLCKLEQFSDYFLFG